MNQRQQVTELFGKHAQWYVERFMDVSLYADALNVFLTHLPNESAPVLDVGCGPGNLSRYALNQRPDLHITGVDLAPAMIELAQKYTPEANFLVADWKSILEKSPDLQGVIAGFITPYLDENEVNELLKLSARGLVQGGVLYLSTMEDDYCNSGLKTNSTGEQVNMYYYTEKQLTALLEKAGFHVDFTDRKNYDYNDSTVTDLLIIALKQ